MPTYEYRCEQCGHELEIQQSMKDDSITLCPNCNTEHLERIISLTMWFVKGEPTTIGQLAEKNSKKMGKYKVDELTRQKKEDAKDSYTYIDKDKYKKLQKKTPEQINRYILEGK